jgi:hypothetical protein
MQVEWINFIIVIFTQLLLFIICAYYEKKFSEILPVLGWGTLIAIIVGIPFDLVVGKLFGIHSFALGFGVFFLIINAIFSYGLFTANILLLEHARLPQFILWNIVIVAVYEIVNSFFTVWTWKFTLPPIKFIIVLLVGYFMGAILIAIISHIFLKRRFLFIDKLIK